MDNDVLKETSQDKEVVPGSCWACCWTSCLPARRPRRRPRRSLRQPRRRRRRPARRRCPADPAAARWPPPPPRTDRPRRTGDLRLRRRAGRGGAKTVGGRCPAIIIYFLLRRTSYEKIICFETDVRRLRSDCEEEQVSLLVALAQDGLHPVDALAQLAWNN